MPKIIVEIDTDTHEATTLKPIGIRIYENGRVDHSLFFDVDDIAFHLKDIEEFKAENPDSSLKYEIKYIYGATDGTL